VSTTPEHLVRCVFGLILALAVLNHSGFSVKMYALEPDQSKRIVPTPFANRVWIIDALLKPDSSKFTRGSLVDTSIAPCCRCSGRPPRVNLDEFVFSAGFPHGVYGG
jgi:hypothetical protein